MERVGGKNKISRVAWKHVLADKEMGGLGVGSLTSLNISLLCKWIWRLKQRTLPYGSKLSTGSIISPASLSPIFPNVPFQMCGVIWWGEWTSWKNLALILRIFVSFKIGSGCKTLFWLDNWTGGETLATRFPFFYLHWTNVNLVFLLIGYHPMVLLGLGRKTPTSGWRCRSWVMWYLMGVSYPWDPTLGGPTFLRTGCFTFIVFKSLLTLRLLLRFPIRNSLDPLAPLKVVCFVWRASMDHIPFFVALSDEGLEWLLSNVICVLMGMMKRTSCFLIVILLRKCLTESFGGVMFPLTVSFWCQTLWTLLLNGGNALKMKDPSLHLVWSFLEYLEE